MPAIRFGAAYYEEYLPYDRLQEDVAMMKAAGFNTVRIGESTWATCEPREGEFDLSHIMRVLDAMEAAGIGVIVGTPTYAVPPWLAKRYPQALQTWEDRPNRYGPRQNMDITDPDYRRLAERIIRRLLAVCAPRKCVIGYQLDNETKHYGAASPCVRAAFFAWLREEFGGDLERLNRAFGFDYWSGRIGAWEDLPDPRGTVNGSYGAAFARFQRGLVTEFLAWQAAIVEEYRRPDQFITHNFDFAWCGWSCGLQPDIDQRAAARAVTVAGCDIYHPGQDRLTGREIALGGAIARGLKRAPYLVLETQAQGYPDWTPYPGQLTLQAYSHLAAGAAGVEYWHWHSLHNACESYWKGVLSHDFSPGAAYREIAAIGAEFARLGERLAPLQKPGRVAVLVSHEAQTALRWFRPDATAADAGKAQYNDILRWLTDGLFDLDVEYDILWPDAEGLESYAAVLVPALYAAPDALLRRLDAYAAGGGVLITTCKTAFADEHCKIWPDAQPHGLPCLGVRYDQFVLPHGLALTGPLVDEADAAGAGKYRAAGAGPAHEARLFAELLTPTTARVLARYEHPAWGGYAAVTENDCGAGHAYHFGCLTDGALLRAVLRRALTAAGIDLTEADSPVTVRQGVNGQGHRVRFYLNYSGQAKQALYRGAPGRELRSGTAVAPGQQLELPAWGVCAVEED